MATEKLVNCTLIRNKSNAGFCSANNQVLKMVQSDFILLLNPDTKLISGTLEKMLSYLKNNPEVGIVGPKVLYPNGKFQYTAFSFPTPFSILLNVLFLDRLFSKSRIFNKQNFRYWYHREIREVDAVSGCCLLMRKKVYDKIGGLDEKLFFMDDIDFCKRAKNKRWKVIYFPKSIIYHYGGGSSKKNRFFPAYFGRKSKMEYFKKHHAKKEVFLIKIIFLVEIFFRITVDFILYITYKNIESRTRLKAYFGILKFILLSR